jgi:hypothetical protein
MDKKDLVLDLNKIYSDLENLPGWELESVIRQLGKITDSLGSIITTIEEESITDNEKESED